jgi:predicted DNA-binding transcriptional regulator YafY
MRRADRLFQVIQLLRGGRLVTAQKLAEKLEVSERTVYRDIADLQSSGVRVDGEAGVGYVLRKGFELPPLMFNRSEIEAVVLGMRMVEAWGSETLAQAARQAMIKIEAVLPEDVRDRIALTHLYSPGGRATPELRRRLDTLRDSIRDRSVAVVDYRREDGDLSRRRIRPLGLFFWGGVWTVVAWCELRVDFRSFRVDRMDSLETLEELFPDEPDKSLAAFLARVTRERPP